MKKYELTNETIELLGRKLYRMRALKDFFGVTAGDLGGYIEKEENLSQDGLCWVYGNAEVWGDACVYGNAKFAKEYLMIADLMEMHFNNE